MLCYSEIITDLQMQMILSERCTDWISKFEFKIINYFLQIELTF